MTSPSAATAHRPRPVAYVMSRFPKLTETFVLFEILAVERLGQPVELFPLLREREPLVHPEAAPLVERAHYLPFLSRPILASQLHFLRRRPRAYLGALAALITGTFGSRNYFLGGLAIFPKVVHAARLMERAGVRHVHCHFSNHPAAAGFIVHRLTGIPYSFVAHGSDLHVDRRMLGRKVAESAFAVAISEDNRVEMLAECRPQDADRIVVIHCGVDTSRIAPAPPTDVRPFTIATVGTLHEVKGQAVLVEAVAALAAAGVDVRCRLVGDGPDRAMLERLVAARNLSDRVTFEGRRTHAQVLEIMAAAAVVAAPSVRARDGKREGIPVVLMEAMALGRPVVASRLSGIPELVRDGENGLLAAPGDPADLATALRRLADDPALGERLGRAARATIVDDFDLLTNASRLLRLIDAPAARPGLVTNPRAAEIAR